MGEGAAVLVFEAEDHARARGATILARVAGFGMTSDAADIVAPSVDGATRAAMLTNLHLNREIMAAWRLEFGDDDDEPASAFE